ncbi:hypothetical protein EYR40_009767 [Pleurotus pulmonarius]|nr:hypothetical protein EYR38_002809 [Pleurotus pulmonarius]KAF4591165.1 hypothetical protein EYR40_009767 [Pleurotus pulmonarius]
MANVKPQKSQQTAQSVTTIKMGRLLVSLSFFVTFAVLSFGKPANDWSKPCFHGECAYDMPEHTGHSGALKIFGSPRAITDITPAAGWVILDCDPHSLDQEVRLVCASDDADDSGCNHIFDHGGPEDKLVRLPESCGGGPFLRIANARVSEDQSIPHHAAGKISRRDGVSPTVHVIKIDSNLAAIDAAKTGTVSFVFAGANVPGVDGSAVGEGLDARGLFDWISNAFNTVKNAVVNAANAVADAAKAVVKTIEKATSFTINPEHLLKLKHHTDHDVVVFEAHSELPHSCANGVEVSLKVEAGGSIDADVKLGLVVHGSVIPPHLGDFAVYAIVDANVDAHLHAHAYVHGHLDTGRKELLKFPITPIQIQPIFSLGPEIRLDARAELELAIEVDIDAHLKYNVNKLEFWYPKDVNHEVKQAIDGANTIKSDSAPFSISATAGLAAEANIKGHLIPQLHLGFKLLNGAVADLSAYVEVDVWAQADVIAEASAHASHKAREIGGRTVSTRDFTPPYLNTRNNNLDARNAGAQFMGCLTLSAGLSVEAGAKGSFVGGFTAETQPWKIWETKTPISILHKCWGGAVGQAKVPKTLQSKGTALTCGAGSAPVSVSKDDKTEAKTLETAKAG